MVARLLTETHPLGRMRDEMGRLFEGVLENLPHASSGWALPAVFPAVNLWEDDANVYAEAELPGLSMDEIDVSIVGNEIVLKGQRKDSMNERTVYHRRERGVGTFSRVFQLPVDVDSEKVQANLHDGVLLITLPKAEAAKPRKIEVKALTA